MTIGRDLQALGMREIRENIRAVVARVEEGAPLAVLREGQPSAIMLRFDESQRWERIERSLSALHGLGIYPELARDTAELAPLVAGQVQPDPAAVRGLADRPRAILAPLRSVGVTDARQRFASILDLVQEGRTMTIVSNGRFAVTVIPPAEYDRLRDLSRAVSWFRVAGLDLQSADEGEIADFIRAYRGRAMTAGKSEAAGA
ncbi:MAG: type II toxin-antitoxin system prevent-host-death family antitoxin [Chloroflexota bacterium]